MHRVNLMTDAARFRTAARAHLRWWVLALLALAAALAPVSIWRREAAQSARAECEAIEAGYEPIRRLVQLNRDLRAEAGALVKNHRLELELAQERPLTALLRVVSAAAAESGGELFVEHLGISEHAPGGAPDAHASPTVVLRSDQKMVIEAAATPTYDIARFTEALQKAPIKSVKVISDVVVSPGGGDRKSYKVECTF